MNRNIYKISAIISAVIALIGLVSLVGGIKTVNIGAFVFPVLISGIFCWLYKRK